MHVAWRVAMIVVAILLVADAARAERRRLAFVGGGPPLEHAVTIALSPWEIDVVTVPARVLSPEIHIATHEARGIATGERADAVAWLDDGGAHRTLWLYDLHDDQVVTRQVAAGDIDDATAASIALSLKTLLRASTVAPPQERLGGRAESRTGGPGLIRLEIDGGTRLRASEQTFLYPRVGFAVAWWPRFFDERFGVGLRLEEGIGLQVHVHEFTGRLYDHTPSFSFRGRIPFGTTFSLEPAIGGALHFTELAGGSIDGRPPVELSRVNAALEASLGAFFTVAQWALLGVRASASYWGTWQRYLVENRPALSLPPLQGSVTFVMGASFN